MKFQENFPDPAKATGTEDEIREEFRAVRQLIRDYCEKFVQTHLQPLTA